MLKEERNAVDAAKHLEQSFGVSKTTLLTLDEYKNKIDTTPEWLKEDQDYHIIEVQLYNQPENAMIKTLHDLIKHSPLKPQIHYKETADTFYICPTTNTFDTF